jgi:hypothetical protein
MSAVIAMVYDFDGTLTPNPMQEYTALAELGINPETFWRESAADARDSNGDPMLSYLRLMMEKAREAGTPLTRAMLARRAGAMEYFPGVDGWFDRLNSFTAGKCGGRAALRHYIVSCGNREIMEASSIARHFTRIYGSSYHYNARGEADFPSMVINDTSKTQFLFRVNKGIEDTHLSVNGHMPPDLRPVPFERMIYIGDGMTDVPCMAVCRRNGGHSAAVYNPARPDSVKICGTLLSADRIDFAAEADYREGGRLDSGVRSILEYITAKILMDDTASSLSRGLS